MRKVCASLAGHGIKSVPISEYITSSDETNKKVYKSMDDSSITSNGVTKLTHVTAGVGVGESHSKRGFQKQKICSCRNHQF